MLLVLLGIFASVAAEKLIYYDTYTGRTLSNEEYKHYIDVNITYWCSGSYKPCVANEGRRMDLTCNNLRYPYRGASHTPASRDLPAMFGKDNTPRKTKCGKDTGPARKERTQTLIEGTIPDTIHSAVTVHFLLFMVNNLASGHDTVNYIRWNTHCCQPEGKKDPNCYPMEVPADDTVHQFSGIRCMNMTKPFTFQSVGCIKDKTKPLERINSATNFIDLSLIYGFDNTYRTFEDGLLQYEVENGRVWPVSVDARESCFMNVPPEETRCHKNAPMNGLLGTNFFSVIFWRLHNYIVTKLKKINPGWSDEKLFSTGRDINIAISAQIYYYEHMPEMLGKDNMMREGLLVPDGGYRDIYNASLIPQLSMEFIYSLRWGHTIQPGIAKMYDSNGRFTKQIPAVNLTLRTGFYGVGNNMDEITQGFFRQPMGKADHVVEPAMAETGLGYLQHAFDIPAADLIKGGLLGIPPYVHYRKLCSGKTYTSFKDLAKYGDMEPEYIQIVQSIYEDVEDIPLLVGLWLERKIPGGFAPRTLYCLNVKQLQKFIRYDRHWYERKNRPNAFTEGQLAQIRKATMAWIFCAVGDGVKKIQPKAFYLESSTNKMVSCDKIKNIDWTAWADASCDR